MAGELYRTYEVLIEESVHPKHPKRAKTGKTDRYGDGKIHEALLTTNELFQDAVCYYTIMLAGMCRDEAKNPIWRCWTADKKVSADLEAVIAKLSSKYPQSVFHGAVDVNAFLASCYSYRGTDASGNPKALRTTPPTAAQLEETFFSHIKPLMVKTNEKSGGEECQDLMKAANTVRGWLCNPCGDTKLEGMGIYDCLHREIRQAIGESTAGATWLALISKRAQSKKKLDKENLATEIEAACDEAMKCEWLLERIKERVLTVAIARGEQIRALAEQKIREQNQGSQTVSEADFTKLIDEALLATAKATKEGPYTGLFTSLPEKSFVTPHATKARKEIETTPAAFGRFRRIQETTRQGIKRDDHAFSKPLYRLLWFVTAEPPADAQWKAAAKDVLIYAAENKPKAAAGNLMPFQAEPQDPLFPYFTNCLGSPLPDGQQAVWGEFEQAAMAMAAEDIFKYKIKTDQRARQVTRLRELRRMVEEEAAAIPLTKENSPLGRSITARGMVEDARWKGSGDTCKGIVEMMREFVEGTPWEQTGYRLRKGTIGGWSGLRKRFLRLEAWQRRQPDKRSSRLVGLLAQAVVKEQAENRQGFGSADFFMMLTKQGYHHLWNEEGASTAAAKKNGIKDFVHYFATYSEWIFELTDLFEKDDADNIIFDDEQKERIRPISYTFPGVLNRHGEVSHRHLRIDANVATRMAIKLFYPEGNAFAPRETEILVSARRLKRDRIITSEGVSLAALWCPPLFRGEGASLLKADKSDDEDNRLKKLALCWEDFGTKALVQEKLPKELTDMIWGCLGVDDKEELITKIEDFNGHEPEALLLASRVMGIVLEFRREHPDSTFPAKNIIAALDRLQNSLMSFPLFSSSMSLMVKPRVPGAVQQPAHLKVSIGLPFTESISIKSDVPWFPKGSLRGHKQDELRRFWKWPSDLRAPDDEDDETEATKASDLWCGDGTTKGFRFSAWKHGIDPKKKPQPKQKGWFGSPTTKEDFQVLSVDLGNRFAAAVARLRVHRNREEPNHGRVISPEHGWEHPIYAQVIENRILRLQGENAMVWDHKRAEDGSCIRDKDGNYVYELVPEIYGNDGRGRFPTQGKKSETEFFEKLADDILRTDSSPIQAKDKLTYAEMGDHLVWRLKRRISRIRTLFKLRWLVHPNAKERNPNTGSYDKARDGDKLRSQRLAAVMMLGQFYTRPKREEDEKEDPVYVRVRTALAVDAEWGKHFGAIKVELEGSENEIKKSKSAQKRDKLSEAAEAMMNAKVCDFDKLLACLEDELKTHLEGNAIEPATRSLVERVANWCLPLRHRKWHWHQDKEKPELRQGQENEEPDHVPKIHGMRGLGMKRLEQVLGLRQLCQSYAKIERRWLMDEEGNQTGINDLVIPRNAVLPDPCVDLLEKSNELREQRVFQTAHLILTEALGVKLKNPALVSRDGKNKQQLKSEVDLHGDYEPKTFVDHLGNTANLPKCSVIVLEDLSRYRTSQERTKSENSRLMQWAHRKVIDKLVDMAKPFGITIMLVDPAWSSRFDCRTGAAGIRVNEVEKGFEEQMPYAAWMKRKGRAGKENDLAKRIKDLAADFNNDANAKLFADGKLRKKRTLLIAVDGGEYFLPVTEAHRQRGAWDQGKVTLNADKNAAVNIGLRALAHPDRLDIFPRFRTEKKGDGRVRVRNRRGFFASLAESDVQRELRKDWDAVTAELTAESSPKEAKTDEEDAAESSEYPDFFVVGEGNEFPSVTYLPAANKWRCHSDAEARLPAFVAYDRPLFLKKVQEACYARIKDINAARMQAWREMGGFEIGDLRI